MSNIEVIKKSIQSMKPSFQSALPAHIPVEKFMRVAQTVITTSPSLLGKDQMSLFAACTKAAQAGLLPDGKESALVPYGNKVTFIPMYEGLLKLVRNSGELKSVVSQIVYENDMFEYWVDHEGEHILHKPNMFAKRGNIIGAYSMASTKDGGIYIEVLTLEDIEAIEKSSKASDGPWKGPFRNEMIKKSAFKRLYKRLPKSTDLDFDRIDSAIHNDEEFDFNETKTVSDPKDVDKMKASKGPTKLKSLLKKNQEETTVVDQPARSEEIQTQPVEIVDVEPNEPPFEDSPMPESEQDLPI